MTRFRTRAALWLAAALLTGVATPAQAQPPTTLADAAYVMGYFKESLNGGGNVNAVHFAVSNDGLEWTPLNDNNAILTPTLGTRGIRDPFLFRLNTGSWVLVATDIPVGGDFARPNQNIHIWTSPDLVTWSGDRLLNVNRLNTTSFSWAPAVHFDAQRGAYGITYSTVPPGKSYPLINVVYTTDFSAVTTPEVFHDAGSGIIDSHVVTGVNGQNYLYYKSDASLKLVGARSASGQPRTFAQYTAGPGVNRCTEAPTLVKSLTSNTWNLWGDTFCPNARFDLWQGDLVSGNWTQVSRANYTAPMNGKHNTVHPVSAADRDRMVARYGTTSWNRLKSYNFPGHYVRHANNAGVLTEQPFEPFQDSQWRVRPGLSSSSGVSFESVNFPGRYLRHQGFVVGLAANDGTASFTADATFTRVAGLADASWSSFRSINYPDRYLRHQAFNLRVDPVSTATDRADATFRVGF